MSLPQPIIIQHAQVDCNNHAQVINALQHKSKDLYSFWRNYEWLYIQNQQLIAASQRPPVVKVVENNSRFEREIEELQNQVQRLRGQNQKLRVDYDIAIKQIQMISNNGNYQENYKKEITLLQGKNAELNSINQIQLQQITTLKMQMAQIQQQYNAQNSKLIAQNRRQSGLIAQLQQRIDQLRNKPAPYIKTQGPSLQSIEELKRQQTVMITSRMENLSRQAQNLVAQEWDGLYVQLQQRISEILYGLSAGQLEQVSTTITRTQTR